MIDVASNLDQIVAQTMEKLKDFQRSTVERVIHLFYTENKTRVLVSDEVGLGKTMVAKGVIAKLAQIQKSRGDSLVKIVYICSNSAIAGQNLSKLMISKGVRKELTSSSRLSMQHLNIFSQESDEAIQRQYIQLIPLTPDTSFHVTTGSGIVEERALMFAILRRIPALKDWEAVLSNLMIVDATGQWAAKKNSYEDKVIKCDQQSNGEYLRYMISAADEELRKPRSSGKTYLEELIDSCKRFRLTRHKYAGYTIISKLRTMFAQISLDRLEPDLVIMDEFQRFRYLVRPNIETDAGLLAQKFFFEGSSKILLLSATPYKMYSTLEEIEEDPKEDHFREFMDVMDFLNETDAQREYFRTVWQNYSICLREMTQGDTSILAVKRQAEVALYGHICRTERGSALQSGDMVDARDAKVPLEITEADILSYLHGQEVLDDLQLSCHFPVDYIKSCPYLLSFMQNYILKEHIDRRASSRPDGYSILDKSYLWLKRQNFDRYDAIDPGNARLARVMDRVFRQNAEKLLWIPPAKPYYPPGGPFKDAEGFTKTLVFSSWEMVPRMLASLLSYEAERKTIGVLAEEDPNKEARYFHEKGKRYPLARLNFSANKEDARAMTLFCLMYPSKFLANCYNPIDCMNRGLSLSQIEEEIKGKLAAKLKRYPEPEGGNEDAKWYYLLPMLLDDQPYATSWIDSGESLSAYAEEEETKRGQKGFLQHVQELRELFFETKHGGNLTGLGKRPKDLLDVLATMAIASPAICAYRIYRKCAENHQFPVYYPSQLAKVFMNRMNTPESTAVIRMCYEDLEMAHWRDLLNYCKDGNLQAVFDEYAYMLCSGMEQDEELIDRLHKGIMAGMTLRSNVYKVDTLANFKKRKEKRTERPVNIRTHFAVAFTKGVGEKDSDRKQTVRIAFNSPFRPFVLASTSIGQEGLDFHNYCRRIVHWNLPSNPIDIEQREGRINRYACHAIRQNVAHRYGTILFSGDVWSEMFREAEKEKDESDSDLIPYWGLKDSEDMIRIERIVPMYPFSRDELSYERLIKILSLYRLTLGQARQEELLEYIFQNFDDTEDMKELFINLSPFYKQNES